MARINIEDKFFEDDRIQLLVEKIGKWQAYGCLLDLFRTAQKYSENEYIIPLDIYKLKSFPEELLTYGLVESKGEGMYVRGSSDAFRWLSVLKENGRKFGVKNLHQNNKRKKKISWEKTPAAAGRELDASWAGAGKNHQPLYSLLSSPKEEIIKSNDFITAPSSDDADSSQKPNKIAQEVIAQWCRMWAEKYSGSRYPMAGKNTGIILRLIKNNGKDRLLALLRCYLEMNDSAFIISRHKLVTFEQNIESVVVKLDSGISIGRKNAQLAEEMESPSMSKGELMLKEQEAIINRMRKEREENERRQLAATKGDG